MRYLLMIAAVLATLTSCSLQKDDAGEKYLAEDLRVFLDAGNTSDTIEMVDSFGMKDKFVQTRKVKREEDRMDFRVKGDWFYLDMKISIYPSTEGGFGCKLGWIKSMYLDGAKYSDVLVFSPACAGGGYKFDRMYYAAEEGLVRVDLSDSVSLFRVLD